MLTKALKHLRTVLIHKYWVGKYCFNAGLYWRGLTHDLSKFSPTEFWESIKFYTGTKSPIDTAKSIQGYSLAWLHHRGRNDHHHVYWTDNYDEGIIAHKMPFECAIEMICDYLGAARAYLGDEFSYDKEYSWWRSKRDGMKMHDRTKSLVSIALQCMAETGTDSFLTDVIDDEAFKEAYMDGSYQSFVAACYIRRIFTTR